MSRESVYAAEQVVLGRILEADDSDFVSTAVSTIGPHALSDENHRTIFKAAADLHAAGSLVDLITVAAELSSRDQLAQIGGAAALTRLTEVSLASAARAPQLHLGKLADDERMRSLQRGFDLLATQLRDGRVAGVDELKAQVDAMFDSPSFQVLSLPQIEHQLNDLWSALKHREANETGINGVPTGWADLDGDPNNRDAMGIVKGLMPGWLVVLAARPGTGKTTALIDWVRAAASTNHGTLVFTLEMPATEIVELLVVAECGAIHRDRLKSPKLLTPTSWDRVSEAIATIAQWPLVIDDESRTLSAMRRVAAGARAAFRAVGTDLHIVFEDYIQLTKGSGARGNINRAEEVSSFSKGFKELAKDMRITCVILAQFNRGPAESGRPPRLDDLKESGALEEDADLVIGLHRPFAVAGVDGGDTPDDLHVLILKFRHGPMGASFRRTFLGEFGRTSEPLARMPRDNIRG
jgi:replicative DNA helicase